MSDSLILDAAKFADFAHKDQKRKYNDKPYITHPARVAAKATVVFAGDKSRWRIPHTESTLEEIIAAAWCHDVVEDTKHTLDDLRSFGFPELMIALIGELTNPSKGSKASRRERKQMDRDHIAKISNEGKILKKLDRLDNVSEMWQAPLDFIDLYSKETELLLEAIDKDWDGPPNDLSDEIRQELKVSRRMAESWQLGRIE